MDSSPKNVTSRRSSTPAASHGDLCKDNIELRGTEKNEERKREILMATQLNHCKFLKKKQLEQKNQLNRVDTGTMQEGEKHVGKRTPDTASKVRSNAVLRKLAQIESKIMTRSMQMAFSNTEMDPEILDEKYFSARSSLEQCARSSRYLKKKDNVNENVTSSEVHFKGNSSSQTTKKKVPVRKQLGLDSDEEEMRQLLGSSLDFSSENENQEDVTNYSKPGGKSFMKSKMKSSSRTSFPPSKDSSWTNIFSAPLPPNRRSQKRTLHRTIPQTPSPSSNLPRLTSMLSQSPVSVKDNLTEITSPRISHIGQSQVSLSEGSEIKSLDELFSEVVETEDATSESSNPFRLNILSIDDLDSNVSRDEASLKQMEPDSQKAKKSNKDSEQNTFSVNNGQAPLKVVSALTSISTASDHDTEGEIVTEAGISEHVSKTSTADLSIRQTSPGPEESTVNSEYSEALEKPLSVSTATDRRSFSEMSVQHSNCSLYSRKDFSPSLSSPQSNKKWHETVSRVTVKETAVQTTDSPFACHWSNSLTSHSPAVLALNDMLKQHLILTQQFMETVHHLHLSLVESLEKEKFHYHTLAETKEYIIKHKSPPLTIEQALEDVWKMQEQNQELH